MTKEKKESSEYFKRVLENGLTKDNKGFDDLIKEKPAFVKFHSKRCGHCINMAREWDNLDDDDSDIKALGIYIIEVDVDGIDKMNSECKRGTNEGVPYITMVNKDGTVYKDYNGERTADSMKKFIKDNGKSVSSSSTSSASSSSKKIGGGITKTRKQVKKVKIVKKPTKKTSKSNRNRNRKSKNRKVVHKYKKN